MPSQFDIATDTLWTIEQICERLSISRRSFDRMRGVAAVAPIATAPRPGLGAIASRGGGPIRSASQLNPLHAEDRELIGAPPFPPPTVVLGRSPRWSSQAVNEWVAAAAAAAGQR
ncbi:MAG TPA: hypothetical protein VME63_03600 [Dyella sp.]|uniref:hypothetical protein n=1 Tax=Dyella sp. TaxID=1869338 RepID=UPI002C0BD52F|nr:hypothetical protein [Dyella sp.]HTV84460.1 hypothetical protein [Dyella sp.]